jgi:hypothetical protein
MGPSPRKKMFHLFAESLSQMTRLNKTMKRKHDCQGEVAFLDGLKQKCSLPETAFYTRGMGEGHLMNR